MNSFKCIYIYIYKLTFNWNNNVTNSILSYFFIRNDNFKYVTTMSSIVHGKQRTFHNHSAIVEICGKLKWLKLLWIVVLFVSFEKNK